jgi:asparagine synthase (glutamine-hydrolysing)
MCGIAGILANRGQAADPDWIGRMEQALRHRGPDDRGFLGWHESGAVQSSRDPDVAGHARLALAHRRLSIIDLSAAGAQPMSTPDGRFHITFNGEIYNYLELRDELAAAGVAFRTRTDTEVLLHALVRWGTAALPRLTGMFAFALFDAAERRLLLARDFAGMKPLYYTELPTGLAFASEIKALLTLPGIRRRASPQRLFDYLRFGLTDHGPETLYEGIRQVPAAHYIQFGIDDARLPAPVAWWRPTDAPPVDLPLESSASRLRALLIDSVRLHLRSDVPLGVALSGGTDSSAILAAARTVLGGSAELHAFSYVADDDAISEERWIDLAAAAAGPVTVHKVRPAAADLSIDLDDLTASQDEPIGSTSVFAQRQVYAAVRRQGIKVVLCGQGADEILGGYPTFLAARLVGLMLRGRWAEAGRFLRAASRLPGVRGSMLGLRAGAMLLPLGAQGLARRLTGEQLVPGWLNARWFTERDVRPQPLWRRQSREPLREQLRRTLTETSLPALLRYEDRNSMAFSVESRLPILNHALVDFVLSLPDDQIIAADGTTKCVFRRALRGLVPDAILDRRDKIGFATPSQRWMRELQPWIDRLRQSDAARRIAAFNPAGLHRELQRGLAGNARAGGNVWRWISLVRWAERYDLSFD